MKKLQVGAILVAAALAMSACSKGDDGNAITSNETISGGETSSASLDDNAIADDLDNGSDSATDNAAVGPTNAL